MATTSPRLPKGLLVFNSDNTKHDMNTPAEQILAHESWAGLPTARFFRSLHEQTADSAARAHSHHSRRFQEEVKWQGVLTIENRPVVYLLTVPRRNLEAEAELHRSIWNQGVAHLLVVSDPTDTRIYSAHAKPEQTAIALDGSDARLVESLSLAEFALQTRDFALRLETGTYYTEHPRAFSERHHVDRYLLQNLRDTRDELVRKDEGEDALSLAAAHTLLGRVLFICYLHDRGIIGQKHFELSGVTGVDSLRGLFTNLPFGQARQAFFKLLRLLKDDFNGSIFDAPTREEERGIGERHIQVLGRFLSGEEVGRGQMTLGFAAYNFGLIPIETISGIYEEFLAAESSDDKSQDGAFYTPKRLAEITTDIASTEWAGLLGRRVLDPACGSGIFLVLAFNRMAEDWRQANGSRHRLRTRADALREILTKRLCGVDVNRTACRIAAFSLYVAFFDQFTPRDLDEIKASLADDGKKVLPPLLPELGDEPEHVDGGLLPANFFDVEPARLGEFDLIIGNPPWVGRNQDADEAMENWIKAQRAIYRSSLLRPRQKAPAAVFFPQRQSSHAFMWKVLAHLRAKDGRACLVLPSKVWLNDNTALFQSHWSRAVTLNEIVQLADSRRILFDDANCPATIVRFTAQSPALEHTISYIVPKVDASEPGEVSIVVLPADRKIVLQQEWQKAADAGLAPVLWKKRFWGTRGDELLIDRLLELPRLSRLAGLERDGKRWLKGQGFQANSRGNAENPVAPFWKAKDAFLDATGDDRDLILLKADTRPIGNEVTSLYFARNPAIYQPPMVLANQGFTWAAYCDFPVLFQAAVQSIAGPPSDAHLLKFLAGFLGSKLARYFAFHTSGNWGIERDKVHFGEMLRCPFPLPEEHADPELARRIICEVGVHIDTAHANASAALSDRSGIVALAKKQIDRLVFTYFGLSSRDIALVDDTLDVIIPSITPASMDMALKIPTQQRTTPVQRLSYATLLCDTINRWTGVNAFKLNAEILISLKHGLALIVLSRSRTTTPPHERQAVTELAGLLARIHERSRDSRDQNIAYHRGFALFETDRILILKPLALRNWMATTAYADADQLAEAMIGGARKGQR